MINPKNKSLKSLIEMLGIVALLIGLIFVGLELRQNTTAIQAATMQGLSDASQDYFLLLGSDAELANIVRTGRNTPDQLNEKEALQFFYLTRSQWIRFQNAFLQYQRGTMGDEDWAFYDSLICDSGHVAWNDHKSHLAKTFVDYAEACFADKGRPSIE